MAMDFSGLTHLSWGNVGFRQKLSAQKVIEGPGIDLVGLDRLTENVS